jgi:hypothetical protein
VNPPRHLVSLRATNVKKAFRRIKFPFILRHTRPTFCNRSRKTFSAHASALLWTFRSLNSLSSLVPCSLCPPQQWNVSGNIRFKWRSALAIKSEHHVHGIFQISAAQPVMKYFNVFLVELSSLDVVKQFSKTEL